MKFFIFLFTICLSAQPLAGNYQDLRDDIDDLKNDIWANEMYRHLDENERKRQEISNKNNKVDDFWSKKFSDHRKIAIQIGAPKTNPIADATSWARVINPNSKLTIQEWIYRPSIMRLPSGGFSYWALVTSTEAPLWKAVGWDMHVYSHAYKKVRNCANRDVRVQAQVDYTDKFGLGNIISIRTSDTADNEDWTSNERKILCTSTNELQRK